MDKGLLNTNMAIISSDQLTPRHLVTMDNMLEGLEDAMTKSQAMTEEITIYYSDWRP
ncbi:MAG: hypothetical protein HON94_03450 [Methylococcales bacterium]|nr:hypothetical protein [Methylococcales bacterium]